MPHHIAVLAVVEPQQQETDFSFDAPHEQDGFDLNLPPADHPHELQQMTSKHQWISIYKPFWSQSIFCFLFPYTSHSDAESNTHPAQTIFEDMSSNRKNQRTRLFVLVNM
jgi:hypothetical protein